MHSRDHGDSEYHMWDRVVVGVEFVGIGNKHIHLLARKHTQLYVLVSNR